MEQIKEEVLTKSNELLYYDKLWYNKIFLESVEEDIALWKKGNIEHKDFCYFYTDLEGNLLFNGNQFKYATPFSNSRACINNYREWLILDLEKKEVISFPNELTFGNINKFRNDGLALFNIISLKWGSIKYDSYEKTFKQDIPFIWDALEYSRIKDYVYVGNHSVSPIRDSSPYSNWNDDCGKMFTISAMKLPFDKSKSLDYYNSKREEYMCYLSRNEIRYIQEKISSNISEAEEYQIIKDYLRTAYNIGDYYFLEDYKEEINSNKGKIVDVGNINVYQKN